MRCVMCNRAIFNPCQWVAGHPIGPTCYKKRFPTEKKRTKKTPVKTDSETLDLFASIGENPYTQNAL